MGRVWHAAVAGVLLAGFGSAPRAVDNTLDAARVREFVETRMRAARLPAVAVAIVSPEQELYAAAFSRNGSNLTPDTPFLLGSVTKTITALAIAQLADAGRLAFDDPVLKHLPGFALDGGDGGLTVTLRQLLTHTSGLRQWSGHDARAQREARFDHIRAARPPGTAFEYSSLNYIILGQVVEAVSGVPYARYVRAQIFEPLEMRNSFTDLDAARGNGLVRGHRYLYGLAIPGEETRQPEPLVPAGFLVSSARDLGNYLRMLLDEGRFRGRQIVSAETLRQMFTPWGGDGAGPGMGWGIGRTRLGHAGSTPTFSARLSLLPGERLGIVVLANINSGPFFPGTAAVMDGVTRIALGQQPEPAWPYEILLKLAMLVLVAAGAVRMILEFRRWARRGFPRRLIASRRIVVPIAWEAAAVCIVLFVIPRWIGVPLLTILEYFPDLGITIMLGVVTGVSRALMRSFVVADAACEAPTATGAG